MKHHKAHKYHIRNITKLKAKSKSKAENDLLQTIEDF